MNTGWLVPLKNQELALYFPGHPLAVAHAAQVFDKEERLTLFAPRPVSEEELDQIRDMPHDVEYRKWARWFMGRVVFSPVTQMLLAGFRHVLIYFGIASLLFARGKFSDFAEGAYWLFCLPLFTAVAWSLMAHHGRETIKGLQKTRHSPLGIRVVVLPQLTQLAEIIEAKHGGYGAALQAVRELGLKELVDFYRRDAQHPRWRVGPPNPAGVIRIAKDASN